MAKCPNCEAKVRWKDALFGSLFYCYDCGAEIGVKQGWLYRIVTIVLMIILYILGIYNHATWQVFLPVWVGVIAMVLILYPHLVKYNVRKTFNDN